MADVKLSLVTDERQMVKAFEKLQRETIALREQQAKLKEELKNGARNADDMAQTLDGGLSGGVDKLAAMAAGALSARSAIALIRAEYDALIERQREAAGVQIDLSAVQTQAFQNLGDDAEIKTPDALVDLVNKVIQQTDALPRVAWQAMSDALSARGDKTAREAADAVTAAIRLSPGTPEQLPTLAGAALDVGKAAGIDSEQALGFILGIGSKSRVTNLESLSKNVAPGALDLLKFGDDLPSAGALVATISQGVNDTEGAVSRTTAVSLAQQLEKFFQRTVPRDDLTSTESRIKALQADGDLRRLFLEGGKTTVDGREVTTPAASFEKKTFATVREILQGDQNSAVVRQLTAADRDLAAIDPGEKYRSTVGAIQQLPAVQVANVARAFDSAQSQVRANDADAMSSAVRDGLAELRESLGASSLGQKLDSILTDATTDGRPDLETAIEAVRQMRAQGGENSATNLFWRGLSATRDFIDPTLSNEDIERRERQRNVSSLSMGEVETIDALLQSLERLRELTQEQLNETRRLRENQNRGDRVGAVAGSLAIAGAGDK